jgi:hypothetical protein
VTANGNPYLAPRCPPSMFALNSILIFEISFGNIIAPGPTRIHSSYSTIVRKAGESDFSPGDIVSFGNGGVGGDIVGGLGGAEVPSVVCISASNWRSSCKVREDVLLVACAFVSRCEPFCVMLIEAARC